jgi:hypothetical protein
VKESPIQHRIKKENTPGHGCETVHIKTHPLRDVKTVHRKTHPLRDVKNVSDQTHLMFLMS